MTTAGLWRNGDWRHVATGCTALVITETLRSASRLPFEHRRAALLSVDFTVAIDDVDDPL